jgi:RHS repeat-associated protein
VNGVRTYFFYSDEGLIGEYGGNGNEITTYGYAPDSIWSTDPLFQKIGISYYWYQNHHLATPQKITDSRGKVVWSATYDAFGYALILMEEVVNNLRQPGQYFDAETGFHYNWYRYYDPTVGRYLAKDPIGFAGGDVNLYNYVRNNPINFIDPWGKLAFPYHGFASLFAGLMEGSGWESFTYAWDSMWTDYATQSELASDTNIHGMAGYIPGVGYQTPQQAILMALQRVADERACGRHGSAMHTLGDLETPWHAGWEWRGNNPLTNWDAIGHWFLDWVPTPLTLKATYDAYKASRRYLQQIK